MGDAAVVGVRGDGRGRHGRGRERRERAARVGEHHEDRAEVGAGGEQHAPPVRARPLPGLLVGQDPPRSGILGPEARQQADAGQAPVVDREHLLEQVQRRLGIGREHALGQPAPVRGPRLVVGGVVRSGGINPRSLIKLGGPSGPPRPPAPPVEDHPHDVAGVARVQRFLVRGWDHVVGRREHAGQLRIGNSVAHAGERLDLGQGNLRLVSSS